MSTARPHRSAVQVIFALAFATACALNLYGLYAPTQPGPSVMFPGFDKVAHLVSFAMVMGTGCLVRIRAVALAAVLVVHAVVSEVIQHTLLPNRSGDPLDLVADAIGIALGWLIARPLARRWRTRNERS